MRNKFILILAVIILAVALTSGAQQFFPRSASSSVQNQYYQPSFQTYYSQSDIKTYWPVLDDTSCEARQDLILQVSPAGCQPAVVRSDLLADQNVPVFCQIDALQLNPLIDIEQIRNIRFKEEYPDQVVGVGFHPARAALRTRDKLLGSPLINNIGYVVVVLKRNERESSLPDFVTVNLSGQVEYDSGNALGVGRAEFLLSEVSDDEWELDKNKQSFWQGRYSVRLLDVDPNFAVVALYKGDNQISSTKVNRGELSTPIYMPGGYCRAGLQISYDGMTAAKTKARIEITDSKGTDSFDVYEGSYFLNNKCRVRDLVVNKLDDTGYVDVTCGSQKIRLSLNANLISSGDYVSQEIKRGALVYYDTEGIASYDDKLEVCESYLDERYVKSGEIGFYSIRKSKSSNDVWRLYYRQDRSKGTKDNPLENQLNNTGNEWMQSLKAELIAKCEGKAGDLIKEKAYDAETERYIQDAIDSYKKVAKDYPSEKEIADVAGARYYGEIALSRAIDLARGTGKQVTQSKLMNEFIELYPSSELVPGYTEEISSIYSVDYSSASDAIFVDNKYRSIRLTSISTPKKEQASADFIIDGQHITLSEEEIKDFGTGSGTSGTVAFKLRPLREADSAILQYNCNFIVKEANTNNDLAYQRQVSNSFSGSSRTVRLGEQITLCGKSVTLDKVNLEQIAKVRLLPQVKGTQTEMNVTVKIGIEKRAIELSPEKTKEKIDNLNESIQKFETISENLGNIVTGLKGACFATSAVLTVKNFLSGVSGEALARQRVMQGDNGWKVKCGQLVSEGKYTTLNACYLGEADNINSDVGIVTNNINKVNSRLESIEAKYRGSSSILGGESVDRSKAAEEYAKYLVDNHGEKEVLDSNGKKITVRELLDKEKGYENGYYTYENLRDMELNILLQDSSASENTKKNSQSDLTRIGKFIQENENTYEQFAQAQELTKLGLASPINLGTERQRTIYTDTVPISSWENTNPDLKKVFDDYNSNSKNANTPITESATFVVSGAASERFEHRIPAGKYAVGLYKTEKGKVIREVVPVGDNGKPIPGAEPIDASVFTSVYGIGVIESQDEVSYFNKYEKPEVKYYETEPYKGMPAIVPIDTQRGWYAATKQSLPVFGGISAFESNGRVSSFYLCNVGPNHRNQFEEGLGDDICQLINLNTGQPYGVFPGLSETEARTLVNKAVNALQSAAEQYGSGKGPVRIPGVGSVARGTPASNVPGTQCQDFMDPKDCHLLFNLCDPVICPASRCNLGGTYNVADVVQTGIVGSALLCLPNIKEGIYVPVCLTGIKAGIDAYVSVLKTHRDCLQANLDTGVNIGICDQITSVYMCEFFWRQVAPVANIILPKLVESAYGQGTRGGGEYLTVMGAWDNAQKSVNYFTQVYGANALKSFQARSIEEAGGEFCRAFVSAKAPTSFKTLLEADSPPQFYARFSSTKFSDATVPATAQYKVFYHIFGGNDAGIYYRVYLQSPPEASYYTSTGTIPVANGFIVKGEYKTETKDFTAPDGYRELCVDINGEEKCGFGQVSTDFGVNYLGDVYAKEQITGNQITSEKECIGGSPSASALLVNSNPQAAFEEAALPQIYERGIIRICATNNPGSSTDPTRFVPVGYCDDQKLTCWLDKKSVDDAIGKENTGLRNATLTELDRYAKEALEGEGIIYADADAQGIISDLERERDGLEVTKNNLREAEILLNKIEIVFDKLYLNHHKAQVTLIGAEVREIIALAFMPEAKIVGPSQETEDFARPEGVEGDSAIDNGDFVTDDNSAYLRDSTLLLKSETLTLNGEEQKVEFLYSNGLKLDIYFVYNENAVIGNSNTPVQIGTVYLLNSDGSSVQIGEISDIDQISLYPDIEEDIGALGVQLLYDRLDKAQISNGRNIISDIDNLSDEYDLENVFLTLSESYSPSKRIDILSKGQSIGIYLQGNRVYKKESNWFVSDKEIGVVGASTKKIKLLPLSEEEKLNIGPSYYVILDGATINGNNIIGYGQ